MIANYIMLQRYEILFKNLYDIPYIYVFNGYLQLVMRQKKEFQLNVWQEKKNTLPLQP